MKPETCNCTSGWAGANCERGAIYNDGYGYIHEYPHTRHLQYNPCIFVNLQILMSARAIPVDATTIALTLMDGISVLARMASC